MVLIQCQTFKNYIEYIIKKHETLTESLPIHIYIDRINNRLMLKRKIDISWNYKDLKLGSYSQAQKN